MKEITPIRLSPAFKDYIWGGRRLVTDYNKKCDMDIVAESWELSCHKDGQSVVTTGEFAGKTLSEYIDLAGGEILGENAKKFDFFPILIKFIDAKSSLSIQVHPDDEYAKRVEGEYGKSEMWYILEAEEDAYAELERSIVAKLADDIVVGVRGKNVEIVVEKSFGFLYDFVNNDK